MLLYLRDDMDRRTFLNRLAVLAALGGLYPADLLAQRRVERIGQSDADWLGEDPWKTLTGVQRHLFPATHESPGAEDIGAIEYLRAAIDNPRADGEDRSFIVNGVGWLNELAHDSHQQPFVALNAAQRESMLRRIEQSTAGSNWLSLLLTYLLEALLADPVYGGNPGGAGWRWLAHQPGFPTPPPDKRWYELGAPVHFQRKAT